MDKKEYIIWLDIDSTIGDFDAMFAIVLTNLNIPVMISDDFIEKYGENKFWDIINNIGESFWSDMPPMRDYKILTDFVFDNFLDIRILSACTQDERSVIGKREWLKKYLPQLSNEDIFIVKGSKLKQNYATSNGILIDDNEKNISQWKAKGGIGILHTSALNSIKQLTPYV